MTQHKPYLSTNEKFYKFEEFEYFKESLRHKSTSVKWKGEICNVLTDHEKIVLSNDPDEKQIKNLLKVSSKSFVGKGTTSLLDEKERKSMEIKSNQIELDPDFKDMIRIIGLEEDRYTNRS